MLNIVSIWLFFLEKYDIGYKETIALCGTRCVIIDIQAPSFTRVNSLRLQSQCLAITAFCKAPQKDKSYLSFMRPYNGLIRVDPWRVCP